MFEQRQHVCHFFVLFTFYSSLPIGIISGLTEKFGETNAHLVDVERTQLIRMA